MSRDEQPAFREQVRPDDAAVVRGIVTSTGFFHDHEVAVAVELVEERLEKGKESGYLFLFAEQAGRTVGYCCYGEIPCTAGSFDLYWIAVHQDCRGQGIGGLLMGETERRIAAQGGRAIWVETSGQQKYLPTREFYLRCGYRQEALLKDFYAAGDDKIIYVKYLEKKQETLDVRH
jgi:ribosomal protein S18 acetylase RimI-like enzyme